jgi:hypothetical protein
MVTRRCIIFKIGRASLRFFLALFQRVTSHNTSASAAFRNNVTDISLEWHIQKTRLHWTEATRAGKFVFRDEALYTASDTFLPNSITIIWYPFTIVLGSWQLPTHSTGTPSFIEPVGSLSCAEQYATRPKHLNSFHSFTTFFQTTVILSSHLSLGLTSDPFVSGFSTRNCMQHIIIKMFMETKAIKTRP